MNLPAYAPARGSYVSYAPDRTAPILDVTVLPVDATAPSVCGAGRAESDADLPFPDLLAVQHWALAISTSRDLPELAERLGASVQHLGARTAVLFPWDQDASRLVPAPSIDGSESPRLAALRTSALSADILAGGAFWGASHLNLADAAWDLAPVQALGWRAVVGVPLWLRGELVGLLYVAWEAPHRVTARERTLLEVLAQHAAVGVGTAQILAENRVRAEALERAEQQMVAYARDLRRVYELERARRAEVQEAYVTTVKVLATAIETRDSYTGGHVERVANYSLAIGRALGWDEDQLMTLELGALLHDVGKIGVDDAVLRKPARLEPDEWEHMQRHPALGTHMLRDVPFLQASLSCVLYHHERFDGGGYPYQLAGEDIPLQARIVAVADTYDAMTSDRPYRAGSPPSVALAEIARCAGSQFDPQVVSAFLRVVAAGPLIAESGD